MYPFIKAFQDGGEVFLDRVVTGAFSHASLISLPFAIDNLVPAIETALDGASKTDAEQSD